MIKGVLGVRSILKLSESLQKLALQKVNVKLIFFEEYNFQHKSMSL